MRQHTHRASSFPAGAVLPEFVTIRSAILTGAAPARLPIVGNTAA